MYKICNRDLPHHKLKNVRRNSKKKGYLLQNLDEIICAQKY